MRKASLFATLCAVLVMVLTPSAQSGSTHSGHPTCWGCATPQEKAQTKKAIRAVFGHGWRGRVALCIAEHESGFNPYAVNWSDSNGGSHGTFQLNGIHRYSAWARWSKRYIPWHNARAAYALSKGGYSWSHWTTAYKCR